jgi:hypothetical protein
MAAHFCSESEFRGPTAELAVSVSWLTSGDTDRAILEDGGSLSSSSEEGTECSARLLGTELTVAGHNGASES